MAVITALYDKMSVNGTSTDGLPLSFLVELCNSNFRCSSSSHRSEFSIATKLFPGLFFVLFFIDASYASNGLYKIKKVLEVNLNTG